MEVGNKRMFRCDSLPSICFGIFQSMKNREEYSDLTIKFGKSTVSAHRIVVAAVIPYFRDRIARNEVDSSSRKKNTQKTIITVEDIDPSALEDLIEFAYTHTTEIRNDNVERLLTAADKMNVEPVRDACIDYLAERLCAQNVFNTYELADRINCLTLRETVNNYVYQNFDGMLSKGAFLNAPFAYVKELITKDDLQTSSEERVLEFVLSWIKTDPTGREHHLLELLSSVRMEQLHPHYLINRVLPEKFINSSAPCKALVNEAINFPTIEKSVKYHCKRKSYGGVPSGIYLISEESSVKFMNFHPKTGELLATEPRSKFIISGSATEMNGKVCYLDRGRLTVYNQVSRTVCIRNINAAPRIFVRTAVFKNMLYVCGGQNDEGPLNSVECFDIERDFKKSIAPTMLRCRALFGLVVLGKRLYAMGGQDENSVQDSVEKYTPDTGLWRLVSSMMTKRYDFACTSAGEKIYVCGGVESLARNLCLASAEMYDPELDRWNHISPMKAPRFNFSLVPLSGKLYAIGGQIGMAYITSVKAYDPERDEWGHVPFTNIPYSGVKAVSLQYCPPSSQPQ